MAVTKLKSEYNTLIKRANQRLRQLEKSGKENSSAYSYIKQLQSSGRSYITTDKHGNVKFRTDTSKLNAQQLSNELKQVERFLEAKTSTVTGIKKIHNKAYKTFANKYKIDKSNFSFNDYLTLYKIGVVKAFNDKYGSDATAKIIQVLTNDSYNVDDIEKYLTDNLGKPLLDIVDATKYNETFNADDYLQPTDDNPFE